MGIGSSSATLSLRAERSNPSIRDVKMDCFVATLLAMTAESYLRSGLLDLFAQNLKLQPFFFGRLELLLRRRERGGGSIELLAILLVEIGIVKVPLLFGYFGLQFGDRFRQRFQRVLFIEIKPALCIGGSRVTLGCFCGLDGGGFHRVALEIGAALLEHIGIAAG